MIFSEHGDFLRKSWFWMKWDLKRGEETKPEFVFSAWSEKKHFYVKFCFFHENHVVFAKRRFSGKNLSGNPENHDFQLFSLPGRARNYDFHQKIMQ